MTTMLCPEADRLRAFYLGQLSDEHSDELLSHVGSCTACQAELETAFNSDDSLIVHLRQTDSDSELANEPACEKGILRALGALATVNENHVSQDGNEAPIEPSLPKSIGEYEILKSLGHGGMGRVYLAKHSKLGRMVALKILARHRLGDRLASQRFESEMRVIGRLAHPNIVIAHDARDIDGTAVLVTEYIDGLDLGQLIHRIGRLEIADACEIIRQVAEALQYTSDQGFVHRDVKPSNIMVSQAGEVKLLDLGLARLQFGDTDSANIAGSAEITGTGQTMGTADYISPEQVTDSRKVDVRSDIYSLGATLYKLLSGHAPFVGEKYSTAFAKMTAHVSASPTNLRSLRADVPIELERLVASMLSKRPEDRPPSPNEVAIKLNVLARGCDLKGLIHRATSITSLPTSIASTESTSNQTTKPKTQPFLRRPIPVYKAIAAGFFGMVLGLCLGIIITITNPDGSKTTLSIPDGSKVEIAQSGKNSNEQSSLVPATPATLVVARPLQFALMVNRESSGKAPYISDKELDSMLKQLSQTNSSAVVQNDFARFVRMADGSGLVEVPISAWNNGIQFALVSTDRNYSVTWDEIEGRILESKSVPGDSNKEAVLALKFDKTLGEKMSLVSTAGIGSRLAIMVDNIVVQSPKINSKIGTDVQISGVFSPSQVQNMRQYFSRSQSTTSNPIKSSVDANDLKQFSEASSKQNSPAMELVVAKLKVIEIDRLKLRERGIDIDTKSKKLLEKSSNLDNPILKELDDASFNRLVDSLVNAGVAKVLSQVSPGSLNGKANNILIDTGNSTIAIVLLPTLQGDSALVHFDFKQTESAKSPKQTAGLPQTTKSRFFSAIVKLNTHYGINTGMATSMAADEQLDTNLIIDVCFERQPIPVKQGGSSVTPAAIKTVNIDLTRMMEALYSSQGLRNYSSQGQNKSLAKELAIASGNIDLEFQIGKAIEKTSPFKGIVIYGLGLKKESRWLSEKPGTAYWLKVSPNELLKDVKTFVDCLAGPGVVEDVLDGMKNDPKGPQLDVRQIVLDRLSEIVVDAESNVIAFKLSDTSSLQKSIEHWATLDAVGPMIIGDYVVFGTKEQLQEVSKRYAVFEPR